VYQRKKSEQKEKSCVMAKEQAKPTGPTHWRKVTGRLNDHLLFAEDLGPVGTRVDVEVVDSGAMKVKGEDGEKDMVWLAFAGKKKRLGLNVGNSKSMEALTGTPDYPTWRGPITLVVVRTKYHDMKTRSMMETDAIRIHNERPRKSSNSKPAEPPSTDDSAFDSTDVQAEDR
jgi:hypothetical protein